MTKRPKAPPINTFEQINQICREFRKQISQGKSPKIERHLSGIEVDGLETLFSNLLDIEISFRRSQGESPSSEEYLNRFPDFQKQVRRAFFEPSMGSVDEHGSTDGDGHTESFRSPENRADALAPTHELPDANRLGDYELIRELGRGGFGVVYEARHTKSGNRVALKTLPTGGDGQQVNADRLYRFRREFRTLSEINHPNLVGMQSLEVDGSQWFFTMDLIDGEDFLSYVRPNSTLDENRLRSCLSQLAEGVMSLHRRGIIHRDLKPSNVLVSNEGRVSVLDFGLAAELQTASDMTQTRSGMFAGTPRYAAPEQMFGERTDASDWYAFGTMLHEALTGQPPFHGKDQVALLRQKQEQEPPQLSDHDNLPTDLAELADGLVRREPTARLTAESIGERLNLNQETRTAGSTQGSHGSTGSVAGDDAEPGGFEEEEVVLIGREEQLSQLEAIKQEFLETRTPQVVWITGLSGEGKSSLVEKFLRPIRRGEEMLVLSGRCYDRESVPFKAIDSIIDPLVSFLRSQPENALERILPPDIEMLARLFPVLRRVKPIDRRFDRRRSGIDEKTARNLAFAAFADLLVSISQQTPIAVFIDDLQWGDLDSAQVLVDLLGSRIAPGLLLLGSYRSDEMSESPFLHGWNQQRVEGFDSGKVQTVSVNALSEEECRAYLVNRFGGLKFASDEGITELFEQTRGNPWFLEQLVEGIDPEQGRFLSVPLVETVYKRLSRCPPNATHLLEVVAVAGKAVRIVEAVAVADLGASAISTLTHMRSERLVRLLGSHQEQLVDTYHDKVRESVLQAMNDKKRGGLHRTYADVIASSADSETGPVGDSEEVVRNDRVFDLAHHLREAGDSRAFKYQLKAGNLALETCAMEAAIGYLKHAKEILPYDVSRTDQFVLCYSLGRALSAIGLLDEAISNYRLAISFANSRLETARCHFEIGEAECRQSQYGLAKSEFDEAFRLLGERNPRTDMGRLFAGFLSVLSIHLIPRWIQRIWSRRSLEDAELLAERHGAMSYLTNNAHRNCSVVVYHMSRAAALAKQTLNHRIKSEAFCYYSGVLLIAGLRWLAFVGLKTAAKEASLSDERGDTGVYSANMVACHMMNGEHAELDRKAKHAVPLLQRTGHHMLSPTHHYLWHSWAVRGNSSNQEYHAKQELQLGKQTGDEIVEAWGKYGLAEGLARQGRWQDGLRVANEALTALEGHGSWTSTVAKVQKTRVQLQMGDHKAASQCSREAMRESRRLRFVELTAHAFPLHVEARLGTDWVQPDTVTRAPRGLSRVAMLARFCGWLFPTIRPHAFRVSGRLAAAKRKKKGAIRYFDKAIAAAEKFGAGYEHARALIDKSMLDHPDSASDRERGIKLLESLGCVLPDAELKYLGIDREKHHARAAAAREVELSGEDEQRFAATMEAKE